MIRLRRIDVFCGGAGDRPPLQHLPAGYSFAELDAEQLANCRMGREKNRAEQFGARLAEGHRAVGFLDGQGQVVCYLWVSGGQSGPHVAPFESRLRVRLGAHQLYVWDCRTDPDHQGRGLYRHGLAKVLEDAAGAGLAAFIVSRHENVRSRQAIEAADFRCAGRIYTLSIGRVVLVLSGACLRIAAAGQCIGMPSDTSC